MRCPQCGERTHVYDSRRAEKFGYASVHRRRRCNDKKCEYKINTYEIEEIDIRLIRSQGNELRRIQPNNGNAQS